MTAIDLDLRLPLRFLLRTCVEGEPQKMARLNPEESFDALKTRVKEEIKNNFPVESNSRSLTVEDVEFDDQLDPFDMATQKDVKLKGQTWGIPVKAKFVLTDKKTGKKIRESKIKVATLPKITSRYSNIVSGSEYQIDNQWRLKPGVYTRIRSNGELESRFNFATQRPLNMTFDPQSRIFRMEMGGSKPQLYPILKAVGMSDSQLEKAWGKEILEANKTTATGRKLNLENTAIRFAKKVAPLGKEVGNVAEAGDVLRGYFQEAKLDPSVTKLTLGEEFDHISGDVVARTSSRLLGVARGDQPDTRDSLEFKELLSTEDFVGEKIKQSAKTIQRRIKNNIDSKDRIGEIVGPDIFDKPIREFFTKTSLSSTPPQTNPLEILSNQQRTTITGEGGVSDANKITEEAKLVDPSHFGFLDALHTPECHSEDTLVQTRKGWECWDRIRDDTEFACCIEGRLEFHKASRVVRESYAGMMFGAETPNLSYLVTPNHTLLCMNSGQWKKEPAESVHGQPVGVPTAHPPYLGDPEWCAKNPINLPEVECNEGFDILFWAESIGKCLSESLIEAALPPEASIPKYFFHSPFPVRMRLLEGLIPGITRIMCDSIVNQDSFSGTEMTGVFTTTDEGLADDIERIATSLGFRHTHFVRQIRRHKKQYMLHEVRLLRPTVEVIIGGQYTTIEYNGMVYCATVPGGLLRTRRGEKGPIWTGNSGKTGVSLHLALSAKKEGRAVKLPLFNLETRKDELLSPEQVRSSIVAMPDEGEWKGGTWVPKAGKVKVSAKGNEIKDVSAKDVKYVMSRPSQMFSLATNLVPFLSSDSPNRSTMAGRHMEQAISLRHREAPLVQSGKEGAIDTFDELIGTTASQRSPISGKVSRITNDSIEITDQKGKKQEIGIYDHYPVLEKKSEIHSTPVVKEGDQIKKGDLIADTNYSKDGVYAPGTNLTSVSRDTLAFFYNSYGQPLLRRFEEILPRSGMTAYTVQEQAPFAPEKRLITSFVAHHTNEQLIRVKTLSGRFVDATASHSFVVFNGDHLQQLTPDQLIPKKSWLPRLRHIDLPETLESVLLDSPLRQHVMELSPEFGMLLGFYLAEGCSNGKSTQFAATDPAIQQAIVAASEACECRSVTCYDHQVTVFGSEFACHFGQECGKGAKNKKLPSYVFGASRAFREAVLGAYWAGDGSVSSKEPRDVMASSASRDLRDGLMLLCASLDIDCTCRDYEGQLRSDGTQYLHCWVIRIANRDLSKFPYIPCPHKEELLRSVSAEVTHDRNDMVPIAKETGSQLRQLVLDKGYDKGSSEYSFWSTSSQRDFAPRKRILQFLGEESLLPRDLKQLHDLANNDSISWDRVESIEPQPYSGLVYDFEMGENPNFSIANGLIVHNTAYTPWRGLNFEDSIVISQSAAEKLRSDHLLKKSISTSYADLPGKNKFLAYHATSLTPNQVNKLGKDGIVEVGQEVQKGDTLIAAMKESAPTTEAQMLSKLKKSLVKPYDDRSVTWSEDTPGKVVGVYKHGKSVQVHVTTSQAMEEGDKLAGRHGNKGVVGRVLSDTEMPVDESGKPVDVLLNPIGIAGRMNVGQVLETAAGKIAQKTGKPYKVTNFAQEDARSQVQEELKKHGLHDKETITDSVTGKQIPNVLVGPQYFLKLQHQVDKKLSARSRGGYDRNLVPKGGGPQGAQALGALGIYAMLAHGAKCFVGETRVKLSNGSEIPIEEIVENRLEPYVWSSCTRTLEWEEHQVVGWSGRTVARHELVKLTFAVTYKEEDVENVRQRSRSFTVTAGHEIYTTRGKLQAGDLKIADIVLVRWEDELTDLVLDHTPMLLIDKEELTGDDLVMVYNIEVEGLHNYLAEGVLVGNSNLREMSTLKCFPAGMMVTTNKGEMRIGDIVDQREKVKVLSYDPKTREMSFQPILSYWRNGLNESLITVLFTWKDFTHDDRLVGFQVICTRGHEFYTSDGQKVQAQHLFGKTILREWRNLTDPSQFEEVQGEYEGSDGSVVGTVFRTWKPTEDASQYTVIEARVVNVEALPHEQATLYDLEVDQNHNYFVNGVLVGNSDRDQADDLWAALQAGEPIPPPKPTFAYDKFTGYLKGMGINVTKDGNSLNLTPLTDKQVLEMSNGELKDAGRMIKGYKIGSKQQRGGIEPEKSGLFDPRVTGGLDGEKWSHIRLSEPVPNPIFEKAIKNLTNLTGPKYDQIIAGELAITKDGTVTKPGIETVTGPPAIKQLLGKIKVTDQLEKEQARLGGLKGTELSKATKRVKYLRNLKKLDMSPTEAYLTQNVPVMPPKMRPLSVLDDGTLQFEDINQLYKELAILDKSLKTMPKHAPDSVKNPLRQDIQDRMRALTGLGGTLKGRFKGIADVIAGDSPKLGFVQDKLLKRKQDLSIRSTIIPEPNLSLDEVEIPRKAAYELYKPFIVREIRQSTGTGPLQARKMVEENHPIVSGALDRVVADRPIIIKRDPVLHKHGIQAFQPKLTEGRAIKIHPLVCAGFSADFDGDAQIGEIITVMAHSFYEMNLHTFEPMRVEMTARFKEVVGYLDSDGVFLIVNLENFPHMEEKVTQGHIDFHRVPYGLKVIALDEKTNRLKLVPVTGWSLHRQREVEIVTLTRRHQIITDDDERAIYGVDGETLEWVRRRPSEASNVYVPITTEVPRPTSRLEVLRLDGHRVAERIWLDGRDTDQNFEIGYVFGFVAAARNLSYGKDTIRFRTKEDRPDKLFSYLRRFFSDVRYVTRHFSDSSNQSLTVEQAKGQNGYWVEIKVYGLAPLLERWIGSGKTRSLPPFYASAPHQVWSGILSGIADVRGTISLAGVYPEMDGYWFHDHSIRLLQELQHILLMTGSGAVIGVNKSKNSPFIHVTVSDLINNLGLGIVTQKLGCLSECLREKKVNPARIRQLVPIPPTLALELAKRIGVKIESVYKALNDNGTQKGRLSKASARKVISILEEKEVIPDHPLYERWKELVKVRGAHYAYVRKVEKTGIKRDGYDLTVPSFETFMNSSGVILSNTMSGYVPVTDQAVDEARKMYPSKILFNEATAGVMYSPSHEAQVGLYTMGEVEKKTDKSFKDNTELDRAVSKKEVGEKDVIQVGEVKTTWARTQIDRALPSEMRGGKILTDLKYQFTKKEQGKLFKEMAEKDKRGFAKRIDQMKDLGNDAATFAGFSFGLDDFKTQKDIRDRILGDAAKKTKNLDLSDPNQLKTYTNAYDKAIVEMDAALSQRAKETADTDSLSKLEVAAGIKGKGYRQLRGAPVLFVDTKGDLVTSPVTRSYAEGLKSADYWAASSGGRKGVIQKVQSVAEPGYLTKMMMNSTVDQMIATEDCETDRGISLPTTESDVVGRHLASSLKANGTTIRSGELVTPQLMQKIKNAGISKVVVRSPMRCDHTNGVCKKSMHPSTLVTVRVREEDASKVELPLQVSLERLFRGVEGMGDGEEDSIQIKNAKNLLIWDNGKWVTLQRVLRHPRETDKRMLQICSNSGHSHIVTEDHACVVTRYEKLSTSLDRSGQITVRADRVKINDRISLSSVPWPLLPVPGIDPYLLGMLLAVQVDLLSSQITINVPNKTSRQHMLALCNEWGFGAHTSDDQIILKHPTVIAIAHKVFDRDQSFYILPMQCNGWDEEYIRYVLSGLIDVTLAADVRKGSPLRITHPSFVLLLQAQELFRQVGVQTGVVQPLEKSKGKLTYQFQLTGEAQLKEFPSCAIQNAKIMEESQALPYSYGVVGGVWDVSDLIDSSYVYDVTTSSGTFTANGMQTHNCYGQGVTGEPLDLGTNVGVQAAQAIGERGTQLSMKSFHCFAKDSTVIVRESTESLTVRTIEPIRMTTMERLFNSNTPFNYQENDPDTIIPIEDGSLEIWDGSWVKVKAVSRHLPDRPMVALSAANCLLITQDNHPTAVEDENGNVAFVEPIQMSTGSTKLCKDMSWCTHYGVDCFDPELNPYFAGVYSGKGHICYRHIDSSVKDPYCIIITQQPGPILDKLLEQLPKNAKMVEKMPESSGSEVALRIYGSDLGQSFDTFFRNDSLPEDFIHYSNKWLTQFLCGLIDGSGMIVDWAGHTCVFIDTTAFELVQQLSVITTRLKIRSTSTVIALGFRFILCITIDVKQLLLGSIKVQGAVINVQEAKTEADHGFATLSALKEVSYGREYVYDIETSSEQLVVGGLLSHNCSHGETLVAVRSLKDNLEWLCALERLYTKMVELFGEVETPSSQIKHYSSIYLDGWEIASLSKWAKLRAVTKHTPTDSAVFLTDGVGSVICQRNHKIGVLHPQAGRAALTGGPEDLDHETLCFCEAGLLRSENRDDIVLRSLIAGPVSYWDPGPELPPYQVGSCLMGRHTESKAIRKFTDNYPRGRLLAPEVFGAPIIWLRYCLAGVIDERAIRLTPMKGPDPLCITVEGFALVQQLVWLCVRAGVVPDMRWVGGHVFSITLRPTKREVELLAPSNKMREIEKFTAPRGLEQYLIQGATSVVQVGSVSFTDGVVYDVTTDDEQFIAGGLLSHNSGGIWEGTEAAAKSITAGGFDRALTILHMPKKVKGSAKLATLSGTVEKIEKDPAGGKNVTIDGTRHYIPENRTSMAQLKVGTQFKKGDPLTHGPVNPHEMLPLTNMNRVQGYLASELHGIYGDLGIKRRNSEVMVRALSDVTKVEDQGDHPNWVIGDFVPTTEVNKWNRTLSEKNKQISEKNKQLGERGRKPGRKPVSHSPVLKGVRQIPEDVQTDWLARLNHEGLKSTIVEAAQQGWTSQLHGTHPIPPLIYGAEFGKGTKDKPWSY